MRFRLMRIMGVAVAIVAGATGESMAGSTVWAVTADGQIGTLDLTTGDFTTTGKSGVFDVLSLTSGPDGSLYAGMPDNSNIYTVDPNGHFTRFGTASGSGPFIGLAYSGPTGFYGFEFVLGFPLAKISSDGDSIVQVGNANLTDLIPTGGLAFGPGGGLFFDSQTTSGIAQLYGVSTTTGAATAIGSGLGTINNDGLSLVYTGGQLYGIDTWGGTGIYTINTTTGVATYTGVNVPSSITINAAAAPYVATVPEPSTQGLALIGTIVIVVARSVRRRNLNAG